MAGLKIVLDTSDAVRAAEAFAGAIKKVKDAVGEAGSAADKFQASTDKLSRRFGNIAKAAERGATAVDKFSTGVKSIPAVTDRASASVQRLGVAARGSGGQLQTLVRQFLGIQAARATVSTIADLESGLVTLGTVTGKTGAELDELRDIAVSVARDTKFTPEETVGALLDLSRAGQDAAEASESLISVTRLAQAGVTTLGQAANLTAASMAQFRSQNVDAAIAASTLVAVADRTKSTVLSLGASLAQAGQAAATFGVSFSETVAAAGVLQDTGVQASRAGRAIKTILAQLASAGERSEASRESLRLLGLEMGDVIPGQGKKLTDVLRNIEKGLDGLGGQERTNILRNLVGKDFFGVLAAAIEGIEKIDTVSALASESIGELQTKADRQNKTLAASIRGVSSAFQEVLIDANDTKSGLQEFFNTLSDSIRILGGVNGALEDSSEASKNLASAIKAAAVAAGAFAAAGLVRTIAGLASPASLAALAIGGIAAALDKTFRKADEAADRLKKFLGIARAASAAGTRTALEERFSELRQQQAALREGLSEGGLVDDGALQDLQEVELKLAGIRDILKETAESDLLVLQSALKNFDEGGVGPALKAVERFTTGLSVLDERGGKAFAGAREGAEDLAEKLRAVLKVDTQIASERLKIEDLLAKTSAKNETIGSLLFGSAGPAISKVATARDTQEARAEAQDKINKLLDKRATLQKEAEKLSSDALVTLRLTTEEVAKAKQEEEQKNALGEKGRIIVSQQADELNKRLQAAREQEDVEIATLRLRRSVLAGDADSARLQEELTKQIQERILLESGAADGDKDALDAAKKLAQIESDKVRLKLEQILLTRQLAAADKEFREQNARLEKEALERLKERKRLESSRDSALEDQSKRLIEAQLRAEGDEAGIVQFRAESRAADLGLAGEAFEAFVRTETLIAELVDVSKDTLETSRELTALQRIELQSDVLRARAFGLPGEADKARDKALFEREKARGRVKDQDEEEFLQKRQELRELEQAANLRSRLEGSFNSGLQNLIATLASGEGDIKDSLRQLALSLVQDLAAQATENLSGFLAGSVMSLFGTSEPKQQGGIIPAQVGRVIASPTVIQRGGKSYSISEGGGSTPEAVMPLMRDRQGRLGVAGGAGGGATINMNFPGVRTTQEARAVRSTMRQQVTRAMGQGERRSRGARNKK